MATRKNQSYIDHAKVVARTMNILGENGFRFYENTCSHNLRHWDYEIKGTLLFQGPYIYIEFWNDLYPTLFSKKFDGLAFYHNDTVWFIDWPKLKAYIELTRSVLDVRESKTSKGYLIPLGIMANFAEAFVSTK